MDSELGEIPISEIKIDLNEIFKRVYSRKQIH
jgi:hypothetical protein